MKSIKRNVLFCVVFIPLAQGVSIAAEPAAHSDAPVDQVVVQGSRADLVKLAKEVQMAEERFYLRYNEVNTKKSYAVRCYNEATTGSRFKQKSCKPVYETEADAAEAREFVTALGRGASAGSTSGGAVASSGVMGAGAVGGGTGGGASGLAAGAQQMSAAGNASVGSGGTKPSYTDIESGRPEFQKNVVEVVNKSPALIKLLQEFADARKRYDDLYRKVNGHEPAAGEKLEGTSAPAP